MNFPNGFMDFSNFSFALLKNKQVNFFCVLEVVFTTKFHRNLGKTLGFVFAKNSVLRIQQNTQHIAKLSEECLRTGQKITFNTSHCTKNEGFHEVFIP